jgi:short subunit dehydrogenase-like uncharacterized protein
MAPERELAVVVLGASGVTGRRAVEYLRERAPQLGMPWGIAGREPNRLEAQVADWPEEERPEVLRGDVGDPDSLRALAERCRVVVNFAGPFASLAPPVIATCLEVGTDYLDVTGEIGLVARMIDEHHDSARARGVRVVQVAGYEALPFDLLTRLGIERLAAEHDSGCEAAELVLSLNPPPGVPRPSDGASRGTLDSLSGWLRSEDARLLGDPSALVQGLADPEAVRRISPIELALRRRPHASLQGPLVPTPEINPPVIQRSLALAGLPPIRYSESGTLAPDARQRFVWTALLGLFRVANGGMRRLSRAPAPVRRVGAGLYGLLIPHSGSRGSPQSTILDARRQNSS